jgi:hypothetical protein
MYIKIIDDIYDKLGFELMHNLLSMVRESSKDGNNILKRLNETHYYYHSYTKADLAYIIFCRENQLSMMKYIESMNGVYINKVIHRICFNEACKNGNIDIVKYVKEKSDIKVSNNNHYAFSISCRSGHELVAKYLVSLRPEKYSYVKKGSALIPHVKRNNVFKRFNNLFIYLMLNIMSKKYDTKRKWINDIIDHAYNGSFDKALKIIKLGKILNYKLTSKNATAILESCSIDLRYIFIKPLIDIGGVVQEQFIIHAKLVLKNKNNELYKIYSKIPGIIDGYKLIVKST